MTRVVAEGGAASNAHLIKRIRLIHGDIAAQTDVDAIVTAIPVDMDISGSANRRIMEAAGQKLDDFILENIYRPRTGDVYAVPGFGLPVKYIILVMTPKWKDVNDYEDRHILRCYRAAMEEAVRLGLRRIAFPAIGAGRRSRFPVKRAARLAVQGIAERITGDIDEVRIVCSDPEVYKAFEERLSL